MRRSPEFERLLAREIRLFIRETMDGCPECIAARAACHEHHKVFMDLALHPRKYVTVRVPRPHGKPQ